MLEANLLRTGDGSRHEQESKKTAEGAKVTATGSSAGSECEVAAVRRGR